jgi:hypothetical protein
MACATMSFVVISDAAPGVTTATPLCVRLAFNPVAHHVRFAITICATSAQHSASDVATAFVARTLRRSRMRAFVAIAQ